MTSMKAVRIHNYGGADALIYEDAPRPTPGAGQVLIRVLATSVNPVDMRDPGRLYGRVFQLDAACHLGVGCIRRD